MTRKQVLNKIEHYIRTENKVFHVEEDLFDYVVNLERQVRKQEKVINKAIEFINLINGGVICSEFEPYLNDILKILNEVSE